MGECLNGYPELKICMTLNAVKIVKNDVILGNMPKDIAKIFSFALYSGGKIDATVTGKRENEGGDNDKRIYSKNLLEKHF